MRAPLKRRFGRNWNNRQPGDEQRKQYLGLRLIAIKLQPVRPYLHTPAAPSWKARPLGPHPAPECFPLSPFLLETICSLEFLQPIREDNSFARWLCGPVKWRMLLQSHKADGIYYSHQQDDHRFQHLCRSTSIKPATGLGIFLQSVSRSPAIVSADRDRLQPGLLQYR
jgi:hypothetical protein